MTEVLTKFCNKCAGTKETAAFHKSNRNKSGLCKICSIDLSTTTADLDHCHNTYMVRGYLCHNCNCGLGQLRDSVGLLTNAISYLSKGEALFNLL